MISSQTIFLLSAGCMFGGALLGLLLSSLLPEHHLRDNSKDTVKLVAGMIATLAALVLGLLVASAKNSFDATSTEITQSSTKLILLDRVLAAYGPEISLSLKLTSHLTDAALANKAFRGVDNATISFTSASSRIPCGFQSMRDKSLRYRTWAGSFKLAPNSMSLSNAVDGNYFNTSISGNIHVLAHHVRLVT